MAYEGYNGLIVDNPAGGIGPMGPPGPIGPPGPPASFNTDNFTPALNQILFVLSTAPIDPANIILSINGIIYQQALDYTVAGVNITWLNTLFHLNPLDTIQVYYQT